ncbi:hypothetical protein TspCOW1_32140 [Thiohalobacter sp. COW1]|uniref:hypothetical protein n=1 Tax=Thiohalobacter sp. COW1 TaxID=2795687 RepID=UPI0019164404|nr:hypothetical protein [Thiohalobacter sp. COW1]BCO33111.1 hypothetical protein TspCOW1_32140 [Thiohalobacter sp. COW1]
MARSRYPLVARQAWLPIAVTLVVAGLIWYFLALLWALPLLVLATLIAWLFRDPYRQIPSTPAGRGQSRRWACGECRYRS